MNQKKSVSAHPRQQQITGQSKSPSSPKPSKPSSTQPAPNDREGWKAYWEERQQSWRTEREIDQKRQNKLDAQRRFLVPDTKKGKYPFKGMKLSRADIEWLLATHENGRGPVDWSDERQHGRKGLDLRGTDLSSIDLKELPLAGMIGGLDRSEWQMSSAEQCEAAAAQLQRADLRSASLEGASLHYIHLEKADLRFAHLEQSDLTKAHLQEADLNSASFEGADLTFAHLERAYLGSANLKKVFLKEAHLEGVDLYKAHLEGSVLCSAFFDNATQLNEITLSDEKIGCAYLVDLRWNGVNLAVVDWSTIALLGDEQGARQLYTTDGIMKDKDVQLIEYQAAARANRQVATALQDQGVNDHAAHFAYRAQILQKHISWLQIYRPKVTLRKRAQALSSWLFSWFLFAIAGYGYRPSRSFLAYLLVISSFATAYYFLGHAVGPLLSPLGAFVFSMTSFHGRGFFPGNNILLDDPLTVLAAFEALVGLIIEVTFIATLTQRFFNR